jgi:hypothetical protein
MGKPPTQETFLRMAQLCLDNRFYRSELLSWKYLFCWAMYEHWIENYWEEV